MDLVQAILSLIFNAIEAMPQGGVLTFRLEPKDGNRMVLTITDTGVGMSDSVLRRCCRPFFSTKEDGAGVGLTIASSIVRDHNGKFGIVSHVGTGTSVYVEFSTDDSDAGTSSGAKPVSTLALPSSLRLLLVEDDHWVADIVTRMFAREGLAVTVATNGRLGLEVFRAGAFDVVITDRAMPEMNGYELAAAVKKIAPETPIILMTGFADAMQSEGRLPPHIDAVMGKPVTLARLRQSVVEVLGSRKHLKSSADQSITPRK
jgi:CheY-like chemotaxis protein